MNAGPHVPVLLDVAVDSLAPAAGRRIVDGTFGFGGHARALLARGCEVLGLDLDADALAAGRDLAAAEPRFSIQHRSFRDLAAALDAAGWDAVDGVLLDLGVSSLQLDAAAKGFSYRADGPLDLRFDRTRGEPASTLVASLDADALADLIFRLGEERASRRIAAALVRARAEEPVDTTRRLREVVEKAVGRGPHRAATLSRVFQALRIAVNDELGALAEGLEAAVAALSRGGRLAVISYHSLEDRLVKRAFAREAADCLCPPRTPVCACGHRARLRLITRRPLTADADEVRDNPRARSAKLRVAERLP